MRVTSARRPQTPLYPKKYAMSKKRRPPAAPRRGAFSAVLIAGAVAAAAAAACYARHGARDGPPHRAGRGRGPDVPVVGAAGGRPRRDRTRRRELWAALGAPRPPLAAARGARGESPAGAALAQELAGRSRRRATRAAAHAAFDLSRAHAAGDDAGERAARALLRARSRRARGRGAPAAAGGPARC